MKEYAMKNLRNILLSGASGAGKTTLAEQFFYISGMTNRLGKIDEGNTQLDFDPEEISKKMSLGLALGFVDRQDVRINIIDVPGYPDFIGDTISAIPAAETAVIVANATGGFEVGLELAMEQLEHKNCSKVILVNRMDNEHADFEKTLEQIHENTGVAAVPVFLPIGRENTFEGIVDLISLKAVLHDQKTDVPSEMKNHVTEAHNKLMEAVAETDENLLNSYLEKGELSETELTIGLKNALAKGEIVPAFVCSAGTGIGIEAFMDAILNYFPSPEDKKEVKVLENGQNTTLIASPAENLLGYIFKLYADPGMGDFTYVRIFSGVLKSGMEFYIPEKDVKDKAGNMYFMLGKNRHDTQELKAGEIGALVKLKNGRALNTITAVGSKIMLPPVELPSPVMWQSIKALNQSDEDKIGQALARVIAEDPTIRLELNQETRENVISGMGEQQLSLALRKMKNRYKVEAVVKEPRIPYKETITMPSEANYKHKKQTGGRGQYGEVYLRLKPLDRGEGFKFINSVVGGTIPSNYIPAIEKGVIEKMEKGIIAGYQVVDISVDVYFGSYHEVDSSEMAFKIAAAQALKEGFLKAKPILLEPIHELTIIIPPEYMGDVMGDISTRRGRIMGMEQRGKKQYLIAQLPAAEMFNYYPTLKSLTQGRGRFEQKFSHYEKVPDEIAQKIIAAWQDKEED